MPKLAPTFTWDAAAPVVAAEHFGLNHEFRFESLGDQPWERFDEVASQTALGYLRFPGGTDTELYFDISNPDRPSITLPNGTVHTLTTQSEFFAFAAATGFKISLVLPSARFLTDTAYGTRAFNEARAGEIEAYIADTLTNWPGLVGAIEIGNEYEGYMTSREYGRLASRLSEVISDAAAGVGQDPDIFVQAWAQSVSGGMTIDDLTLRNDAVLSEFSADALAHVDGVSSHYYFLPGRHAGEAFAHRVDDIDVSTQPISILHEAWDERAGRDLVSYVSEWNVHRDAEHTGLSQVAPLVEVFAAFVQSGVDVLALASAQYHATSHADRDGALQASGTLFDHLADILVGFAPLQHETSTSSWSVSGFSDGTLAYFLVSSRADSRETITLEPTLSGFDLAFVEGDVLGLVPGSADGQFKGQQGLAAYRDPDAEFAFTSVNDMAGAASIAFALAPYETAIVAFSLSAAETDDIQNSAAMQSFEPLRLAGDVTTQGDTPVADLAGPYFLRPKNSEFVLQGNDGAGSTRLVGSGAMEAGDLSIALDDYDSIAEISVQDLVQLTELYVAYFNRAADNLGLLFWADKVAEGMSFDMVARHFFTSQEFEAAFPDRANAGAFVERIYTNVLDRIPDAPGLAFWTEAYGSGAVSAETLVLSVLDGIDAGGNAADRALLDLKTTLGLEAALQLRLNAPDVLELAFERLGVSEADARAVLTNADIAAVGPISIDTEGFWPGLG